MFSIKYENLEYVKYYHSKKSNLFIIDTMDWASRYGHLGVVNWLKENIKF